MFDHVFVVFLAWALSVFTMLQFRKTDKKDTGSRFKTVSKQIDELRKSNKAAPIHADNLSLLAELRSLLNDKIFVERVKDYTGQSNRRLDEHMEKIKIVGQRLSHPECEKFQAKLLDFVDRRKFCTPDYLKMLLGCVDPLVQRFLRMDEE